MYPNGSTFIVAGTAGVSGASGSGVAGTAALLSYPRGLSLGIASSSDVIIADSCVLVMGACLASNAPNSIPLDRGAHAIRILYANGTLSTLAGTLGVSGSTSGPATSALFNQPSMVSSGS